MLNTALHEAAAINDIALVRYLLSVGANASLFNSMGELPFDRTNLMELKKWAGIHLLECLSSHCLILPTLFFLPCSLFFHCRLLAVGNYQLLLAAALGDTESIQRLVLKEGVSVNCEFLNGWTALHEACETENEEAASLLLELGADVNKTVGVHFLLSKIGGSVFPC